MNQVMICSPITAKQPYRMKSTSTNIYTIEELCFYLTTHLFLIEDDIKDPQLCKWLSLELKENYLSEQLLDLLRKKVSTALFVKSILELSGYSDEAELNYVEDELRKMEQKSPLERKKMRMDKMAQTRRYVAAIRGYEQLLRVHEVQLDEELAGSICHNMGCCYANLFLFENAKKAFSAAYRVSKADKSRELMELSERMQKEERVWKSEGQKILSSKLNLKPEKLPDSEKLKSVLDDLTINCRGMYTREIV
ncbi:hypothetical protein [Eubacterium oxidoreducens]|uniref:Tetratricopeptide repeat-containing protein n=1 Tax=Eubacterium oxidoreducens TaxID=1732 RepID=A0A1G6BFH6_EUBOX|nr:hypothetical protein [Eubacterium oxidoreducens]SDB19381.1 hypothetical protein SAMN02910417_01446 [Eubacterium oxidoreducens]